MAYEECESIFGSKRHAWGNHKSNLAMDFPLCVGRQARIFNWLLAHSHHAIKVKFNCFVVVGGLEKDSLDPPSR